MSELDKLKSLVIVESFSKSLSSIKPDFVIEQVQEPNRLVLPQSKSQFLGTTNSHLVFAQIHSFQNVVSFKDLCKDLSSFFSELTLTQIQYFNLVGKVFPTRVQSELQ